MNMFEVGQEVIWHRWDKQRHEGDEIRVRIVKLSRNGISIEVPTNNGGIQRLRVARDSLRHISPKPYRPAPPPAEPTLFAPPPAPPTGELRMLGQPAGRIPEFLPKKWDPMCMVGDAASIVHAVPTGPRALCGYESGTGWQWARGQDVSCERCWQKHLEEEFEKDPIVQTLRQYGHTGPITREDYISFNWAGCSIRPWTAEHEDSLPALLQDWPRFYKNARRRETYAERKYGAWARAQVDAVAALHKKG
jgi:hypothetical protein